MAEPNPPNPSSTPPNLSRRQQQQPKTWAWVIGLVALLLIIWAIATPNGQTRRTPVPGIATNERSTGTLPRAGAPGTGPGATAGEAAPPGAVAGFTTMIEGKNVADRLRTDKAFASDALDHFATALTSVADVRQVKNVQPSVDLIRARAGTLRAETDELKRARSFREAADAAASAMDTLQSSGAGTRATAVSAVRKAGGQILPDHPLSDQLPAAGDFFVKAADALGHLSAAAPSG